MCITGEPASLCTDLSGRNAQGDALSHAQEIVDKAVELGIEVLAITDHNSVNGVAAFRAASRNKPVHISPGFELSSSEGVHLLCLYPLDAGGDQLERYLGEFGKQERSRIWAFRPDLALSRGNC